MSNLKKPEKGGKTANHLTARKWCRRKIGEMTKITKLPPLAGGRAQRRGETPTEGGRKKEREKRTYGRRGAKKGPEKDRKY